MTPDQSGFNRTTSDPSTNNFGQTWNSGDPAAGISPLTNPFPVRSDGTRFDSPVGSAPVPRENRLRTLIEPNFKRAREQRWQVDLQRQFGANTMVSVAHSGMYTTNLRITRPLAVLPVQYWALETTRNNAVAGNLNQNVANPFYIGNFASLQSSDPVAYQALPSQGFFPSPTIRKNRLLDACPPMNGLSESGPYGESRSHSIEVVFQRRDDYYNLFDANLSWELTNNGVPYRFAATGIYGLPFGPGKPLVRSGLPAAVVGGWQISSAYGWQPGPLLQWGNVLYNDNPNQICSGSRTLDHWFNTSGFVTDPNQQPAERIGGRRAERPQPSGPRFPTAHGRAEHREPFASTFGKVTNNTTSTMRFLLIQGRIKF